MAERIRVLKDEDGNPIEIVYCRAKKCRNNLGRGKCSIVHTVNGDDLISVNAQGGCENFFTE
jgi:hypothetical protein